MSLEDADAIVARQLGARRQPGSPNVIACGREERKRE
jgi:hypothetical protein